MSTPVVVIVVQNNMSNFFDLKGDRGVDGLSIPGPPGLPGPPGPVINLQEVCMDTQTQTKIAVSGYLLIILHRI